MIPNRTGKRVLLIRLSAIGDVVVTTPVSRVLREQHPDAYLAWVVEPQAAGILSGNPYVDEIIVWQRQKGGPILRELRELSRMLRPLRFDWAVDFQGLLRSALVARVSGARRIVGNTAAKEHAHLLYHERIPRRTEDLSSRQRCLDLLQPLGIQSSDRKMVIAISVAEHESGRLALREVGLAPNEKYACLVPATTWKQKHWFEAEWGKLAALLPKEMGLTPVILGGPGDIPLAERIRVASGVDVTILAGKTSLKSAAAILEGAALTVAVDTGLMHASVAVGTPTVGVCGASWWKGFSDYERFALVREPLPCSPCLHRPTCEGRYDCMRAITPQRVLSAARSLPQPIVSDFESTWRDLISGKTRGARAGATRSALSLLSGLYGAGVGAYRLGYDWRLLKQHRLSCPALSIGNLTVGGTGKTTTVRWLTRKLLEWERHPAILSYGYRADKSESASGIEVTIVAGPEGIRVPVKVSGDEAQMLARSLPGVPVVIGKRRVESGKLACASFPMDVCVLDDAFQYWRLHKDLEVVLINATNPFGYGRMLPRGMLRESLRALGRAHAVIVTHANRVGASERAAIRTELARWNPQLVVAEAEHAPGDLRDHRTGSPVSSEVLRSGLWVALSGLGQPESFEATVASLSGTDPAAERFPDHHRYVEPDLRRVVAAVRSRRLAGVVTTEKDSVKIPAEWLEDIPCLVVEVDLRFLSGQEELESCVRKRMGES